jgi:hypothetical protein
MAEKLLATIVSIAFLLSGSFLQELHASDSESTSEQGHYSTCQTFTMLDVVRKCGMPDKHEGSGIYIFVYYMNDCSTVSVGTPDLKRLGITHVKRGKATVLLGNWR